MNALLGNGLQKSPVNRPRSRPRPEVRTTHVASPSRIMTAMLGLAVPIAVGTLAGVPRIGMVASLGGLAMSSSGKGATVKKQVIALSYTLIAGGAAVFTGAFLARFDGAACFAIPAIAAVMALVGGISRPLVHATTQFTLYMIIAANLGTIENHPLALMIVFAMGAVWCAGLLLVFKPLFRAMRLESASINAAPQPDYPLRFLLRRWRQTLAHLSGWQYTLRISACLVAAQAFAGLWPNHHGYWASITTVIVVHRQLQSALPRTLHRVAGTVLGILLLCPLTLWSPSIWIVIALIGGLAAIRPMLIEANYTAYAAVMTLLVILLMDFGHHPSWGLIVDRLAATIAGCLFSLVFGYLGWSIIALPIPRRTATQPFHHGSREKGDASLPS